MAATFANMSHTVTLVFGHIDPTLLHKYVKTQPTAISTIHVIAIYGPPTNVPLSMPHVQISSCAHDRTMLVYIPHMNSL